MELEGTATPSWYGELLDREPLFHRTEFIWDPESFDAEVAADFAEISASGEFYLREVIKPVVPGRLAETESESLVNGHRIEDASVVELAHDLAQVRYTLHGQGRVTRRTTLYRRAAMAGRRSSIRARWSKVLFHRDSEWTQWSAAGTGNHGSSGLFPRGIRTFAGMSSPTMRVTTR